MSAVRAERPAMATPILPPPPPRIKPGTWSLSLVALIGTLALAIIVCAAGTALAQKAPQPPASEATVIPHEVAHAAVAVVRSAGALATYTPPAVALVSGTIQGIDRQSGALRLLIDDTPYVFYVGRDTAFLNRCLQRAGLRAGLYVTLSLPWYMGGQLWALGVGPRFGCNPDGTLRLFHELPSGEDASTAPIVPRRTVPIVPRHPVSAVPGAATPSDLPPYSGGTIPSRPDAQAAIPTAARPQIYIRHDALPRPLGTVDVASPTVAIPRLPTRPRGLGEW